MKNTILFISLHSQVTKSNNRITYYSIMLDPMHRFAEWKKYAT